MAPTAQVKKNICTVLAGSFHSPFEVGSVFWVEWVRSPEAKSFHYEDEISKFTARRENRLTSGNDYWYAYKKIQNKLRKIYVGTPEELTPSRLQQVATEISQPGEIFYSTRKSYPIKSSANCVTLSPEIEKKQKKEIKQTTVSESDAVNISPHESSYPIKDATYWVTLEAKLETLQVENEELRSQLKSDFEHAQHELKLQENIATQVGREKDEVKRLLDQTQLKYKNLLEENKGLQIELEGQRLENKELQSQMVVNFEFLHSELLAQETLTEEVAKERDQLGEVLEQTLAQHNGLLERVEALQTELQKAKTTNQQPESSSVNPQAIALLKNGLRLKANAGGAIKRKIEDALELWGENPYE